MKKKIPNELRGRKVNKSKGEYTYSDFQKIRILSYLAAHDTEETNQSDFFKEGKYGIDDNFIRVGIKFVKKITQRRN